MAARDALFSQAPEHVHDAAEDPVDLPVQPAVYLAGCVSLTMHLLPHQSARPAPPQDSAPACRSEIERKK